MTERRSPTERIFDQLTHHANPPMIIVTASARGVRSGCLVGYHSQSGIEPPHYTVRLSKANRTYRTALEASHLAVHFLASDQEELAARFGTLSGENHDKFAEVPWAEGPHGVPLLTDCPHRLVIARSAVLDDGADHVSFSGPVVSAEGGTFSPLHAAQVGALHAGHGAEERALRP